HDALDAVAVQHGHVLQCLHVEEELVASTTSGVTRTALLLAQHGELHLGSREDAHEGLGDLAGTVVEGTHAAHPEEDLGHFAGSGELGHGGDVDRFVHCRNGIRHRWCCVLYS